MAILSVAENEMDSRQTSILLIVAVCAAICLLQACSGELSDNELAMGAMLRADSLIANGYCPAIQRDSLATEMMAVLFRSANRPKGLIKIMKETPNYDANSAALYGLAVGYAMLDDTINTKKYLERAVELGDYHLYLPVEQAKFLLLSDEALFPDLVQASEANYDRMMQLAGLNALRARERRAAAVENFRKTGR